MAEIVEVYDQVRNDISQLVRGLEPQSLETPVPATPGWTIKDVIAHLAADATYVINGDFPRQFFEAFGEADAVVVLNQWTARHLEERKDRSLDQLLEEWNRSSIELAAMMRGDKPWPGDGVVFADRVLLTDATVHQQDIFGALGIKDGRESAGIKISLSGYIAIMGLRLATAGLPGIRFDVGDKSYTAGGDEPAATVGASRFEFFRAMSGRRSPQQIKAYEWEGDPEPYLPYFYPYGMRQEALVE